MTRVGLLGGALVLSAAAAATFLLLRATGPIPSGRSEKPAGDSDARDPGQELDAWWQSVGRRMAGRSGPDLATGKPRAQADAQPEAGEEQGSSYEGVVVHVDGSPVAGAHVVVVKMSAPTWVEARAAPTALTAEDGRFRLTFVGPAWSAVLRARAPGFATGGGTVSVDEGTEARLVLVPARILNVHVRSASTGADVPAARVEVLVDVEPQRFPTAPPSEEATTGADGRASLSIEPPRRSAVVVVRTDGQSPTAVPVAIASDPMSVDVALVRGGSIEGVLVDPDGAPVTHATVLAEAAPRFFAETATDDAGAFRFDHVPVPREADPLVALGVEARDHPRFAEKIDLPSDGETVRVRLQLPRLRTITGRVVGPDGRGIGGLRVKTWVVRPHFRGRGTPIRTVETDADGRFEVDALHPGTVKLRVETSGSFHLQTVEATIPDVGDVPAVSIVVAEPPKRTVSLRLRVVDAAGRPVANADVGIAMRGGRGHTIQADPAGVADVDGVPDAPLLIFVRRPGGTATAVWVEPRADDAPIDVRLGGGTAQAVLVDATTNEPVAGQVRLRALARDESGLLRHPLVAAHDKGDDRWIGEPFGDQGPAPAAMATHLSEIGDGPYRVVHRVDDDEQWSFGKVVEKPRGPLVVRVAPKKEPSLAQLTIEVFEEDGRPGDALEIGATLREGPRFENLRLFPILGSPGLYVSNAPKRGEHSVTVYPGVGYRAHPAGVHRFDQGPVRLKVRRSPGARVEGVVRDDAGLPIAGATVTLRFPNAARFPSVMAPSAITARDGSFRLPGLPMDGGTIVVTGDFVVEADIDPADRIGVTSLEVATQRAGAMDLRLERPPKGGDAVNVWVSLTLLGGGGSETHEAWLSPGRSVTEPERIGGLRPGRYRVSAGRYQGTPTDVAEVDVSAGKIVEVSIPAK